MPRVQLPLPSRLLVESQLFVNSSRRFTSLSPIQSRSIGSRLSRPYSTASETISSTPLQTPKPQSRFRRFVGFTSIVVVAFTAGLVYQTQKTVSRMMAVSVPTDEETLSAFIPPDEFSQQIEAHIRDHPVTVALRENPVYRESRPYMKIPEKLRVRNLTAGTLSNPGGIVVPPYIFYEAGGKSLVSIFYLGSDVGGHPGIVHGGLLATLLDEAMGRCCFPALPNRVALTANLNVDYRRPAMTNNYFILKAETVKVEGRKAWVEGRIETLPQDGQEPAVLVEAKALFVEPKQAAVMPSLYKIAN